MEHADGLNKAAPRFRLADKFSVGKTDRRGSIWEESGSSEGTRFNVDVPGRTGRGRTDVKQRRNNSKYRLKSCATRDDAEKALQMFCDLKDCGACFSTNEILDTVQVLESCAQEAAEPGKPMHDTIPAVDGVASPGPDELLRYFEEYDPILKRLAASLSPEQMTSTMKLSLKPNPLAHCDLGHPHDLAVSKPLPTPTTVAVPEADPGEHCHTKACAGTIAGGGKLLRSQPGHRVGSWMNYKGTNSVAASIFPTGTCSQNTPCAHTTVNAGCCALLAGSKTSKARAAAIINMAYKMCPASAKCLFGMDLHDALNAVACVSWPGSQKPPLPPSAPHVGGVTDKLAALDLSTLFPAPRASCLVQDHTAKAGSTCNPLLAPIQRPVCPAFQAPVKAPSINTYRPPAPAGGIDPSDIMLGGFNPNPFGWNLLPPYAQQTDDAAFGPYPQKTSSLVVGGNTATPEVGTTVKTHAAHLQQGGGLFTTVSNDQGSRKVSDGVHCNPMGSGLVNPTAAGQQAINATLPPTLPQAAVAPTTAAGSGCIPPGTLLTVYHCRIKDVTEQQPQSLNQCQDLTGNFVYVKVISELGQGSFGNVYEVSVEGFGTNSTSIACGGSSSRGGTACIGATNAGSSTGGDGSCDTACNGSSRGSSACGDSSSSPACGGSNSSSSSRAACDGSSTTSDYSSSSTSGAGSISSSSSTPAACSYFCCQCGLQAAPGLCGSCHLMHTLQQGMRLAMKCGRSEQSYSADELQDMAAPMRAQLFYKQLQIEQVIFQRSAAAGKKHMLQTHGLGFAVLTGNLDGYIGPAMFLELASGSLNDIIQKHGALSSVKTRHIICQVVDGLLEVEALGVICRDVKPANILVFGDAEDIMSLKVKLADFGLAKICFTLADYSISRVGTPAFMAPEMQQGDLQTPMVDWYALGGVILTLRTAKLPFAYLDNLELDVADWLRRKANVYGELADPTCAYWRDLTHCEMDLISKLLHPNPVKRGPLKTLNESHPYFTDGPFAFIAF